MPFTEIAQNQIDLPAAVAANQNAGTGEAVQGLAAVNSLLGLTVTSKAAAVQTVAVATSSATSKAGKGTKATAAAASAASATTTATAKKSKNNNKRNGSLKWAKRAMYDPSM